MSDEEWRDIPGYEGYYQASDHGRIRSLTRRIASSYNATRLHKGRVLKPWSMKSGHLSVNLGGTHYLVHRLVALTFFGESCLNVLHRDDDPTNNSIQNLRYGTQADNAADAIRNGRCYQLAKKQCPRGHLLEGANLYPGRKNRSCRSCSAADSWARWRGKTGKPVGDVEKWQHAHEYYDRIKW